VTWHWQYFNGKTLEEKVVLSDSETNAIVISINFERYPELPESKDKALEQIRPKRDPSQINPYSIQGTWNGLQLSPKESIDGLVYFKYEGLKVEDINYFKNIWNLLQFETNPQPNGTITFSYKSTRRICDFVPKLKK